MLTKECIHTLHNVILVNERFSGTYPMDTFLGHVDLSKIPDRIAVGHGLTSSQFDLGRRPEKQMKIEFT